MRQRTLTKSTMTKSSCGPEPSEPWECRLVWRGDVQGGEFGGCTCTHKVQIDLHNNDASTVLLSNKKKVSCDIFKNQIVFKDDGIKGPKKKTTMMSWLHQNLCYHRIILLRVQASRSKRREGQVQVGCGCLDTRYSKHVAETLKQEFVDILAVIMEERISEWPTCVVGLFTKAPVFLVKALREWMGSVGEALRLPSSLLTSPLCKRPSSSPLRAETHLSVHASQDSAVIDDGSYELPTCCRVCWVRSQNEHRLREKAGREPAPPHPPFQYTASEEEQQ